MGLLQLVPRTWQEMRRRDGLGSLQSGEIKQDRAVERTASIQPVGIADFLDLRGRRLFRHGLLRRRDQDRLLIRVPGR
jgi:hypothetical protein